MSPVRLAIGVLVWSLLGCSGADQARIFSTAVDQGIDPPLPVLLRDETGLVTAIEPAANPEGDGPPAVVPDPADSKAFVITWLGGPCERDVAISFVAQAGGYLLNVAASQRGDCPLIGYPRAIRIETSVAIPITSIEVTGRG